MDRGDHLSAGRDHSQADEIARHIPQNSQQAQSQQVEFV
jgi:hypothetical protein